MWATPDQLLESFPSFCCSLWVKLPMSLFSLSIFITKKYFLRNMLEHWVQFVMLFSGSAPNHLHAFPFSEKGKTISPMYFLLVLGWLTVSHNLKNLLKCLMERSVEHVAFKNLEEPVFEFKSNPLRQGWQLNVVGFPQVRGEIIYKGPWSIFFLCQCSFSLFFSQSPSMSFYLRLF